MPVIFQSITPKNRRALNAQTIKRDVRLNMQAFLETCKRDLQYYPPQQPRKKRANLTNRQEQNLASQGLPIPSRARNEPSRSFTYKRTKRLMNGWKVLGITPDGAQGFLVNNTPYAVYAQGPRSHGQGKGHHQTTRMHNLGWLSITDVTRARRKQFALVMNRAVQGAPGSIKGL